MKHTIMHWKWTKTQWALKCIVVTLFALCTYVIDPQSLSLALFNLRIRCDAVRCDVAIQHTNSGWNNQASLLLSLRFRTLAIHRRPSIVVYHVILLMLIYDKFNFLIKRWRRRQKKNGTHVRERLKKGTQSCM